MFKCSLHLLSKKHGWRFEKLRPTFKKWIKIDHPPQHRSKVIKLNEEYDKLIYVCNGRVSYKCSESFLKSAKNYVKKDTGIHTPCLAFVKGGSHILLETLTMDEVEQLENIAHKINKAFDDVESVPVSINVEHVKIEY